MSYLYLLKQEWKYAALKDKIYIVLSISFHIISHIGIVLLPLFFKELINSLEGIQDNSLNDSIVWLFMLFVCFLVFEAFHRLGRFIEYAAGCRIRENCVDKLYRHVYSLPLAWHQANHSGNTINRVRLASESLFTFILYQHTFIRTFVLATGPFIATLFFAPDIAIIICLLVFVSLLANFKFDKILIPIIRKKNENIHSFTPHS